MHTALEQEQEEEWITQELIATLDAAVRILGRTKLEVIYDEWIVGGK